MDPPIFASMSGAHPSYRLCVVQCTKCLRCWVRQVHVMITTDEWLCPRGWLRGNGCAGTRFAVVDRPEVEAAWRLTGQYAFGDMDGHP